MPDVFVTPQVSVVQEVTPNAVIVTQDVLVQPTAATIELLVPGLTGATGAAGAAGPRGLSAVTEQYFFAGPISAIGQAHGLGRVPAISVYLNNELVVINVSATTTSIAISFPVPVFNVLIILT